VVEFDVTDAIRSEADNLVAVRLINPGNTPVDGFVIRECPGRNKFFRGQASPDEVVAGMINTSLGYSSGLTVSVHRLGEGKDRP
jgi:hypothetical protein